MIIHVYVFEHKPINFIDRNLLMSYIKRINLVKKKNLMNKKKTIPIKLIGQLNITWMSRCKYMYI